MFDPSENFLTEPRIVKDPGRILVGMSQIMTVADFPVSELWKRFMPRKEELKGRKSGEWISAAVYPDGYFTSFDPQRSFEKWAAAEVEPSFEIPPGMQTLKVAEGLYAVFHYKGMSSDRSVYQYIFGTWLPGSGYRVDHRPHFEILGDMYRNDNRESEEAIWIPVRKAEALSMM